MSDIQPASSDPVAEPSQAPAFAASASVQETPAETAPPGTDTAPPPPATEPGGTLASTDTAETSPHISPTPVPAPDPEADKGDGTETVDDTGQGPNIPVSAAPAEPAPPGDTPTDRHTFTVAQTVGTSYSSTGVSGTVVKLAADAGSRVDSFVITVGNDIAHLFEAGEKWVLTKVEG